jgi:hypothetical protein
LRKEYALALKLKKNIVPVAHEEFDWPDRSRLPKDCEGVMGMNAVKCVSVWQPPIARFFVAQVCWRSRIYSVFDNLLVSDSVLRYHGEFRDASIQKIKDALILSS